MAHSQTTTSYTERLVLRNGNIYRVVNAHYKKTNMEVLYQIGGKKDYHVRNLSENYVCGWLFNDPNDKFSWYDRKTDTHHDRYEIDNWWKWHGSCSVCGVNTQTLDEIETIILKSKHKEFVYTFRAYRQYYDNNYRTWEVFDLLNAWLEDHRVEYLMKLGQYRLAIKHKAIFRLGKEKQAQVIKTLKDNVGKHFVNYNELLASAKGIENYYLYKTCNNNTELYKYLLKQNVEKSVYDNYLYMAKENGHNIDDPYWKYPSHLRERHNQMMREQNNIKLAKEKKIVEKISEIGTKLAKKLNKQINGYDIAVASSIDDIQEQAETLSQCLMRCDYYKEYANKKCILLFIKKGNERLATAEIFYNKKSPLGQFYADEQDRNNCIPNTELKDTLNTWLSSVYAKQNMALLRA